VNRSAASSPSHWEVGAVERLRRGRAGGGRALGEELAAANSDASEFQFTTMLRQCNEAITEETGVEYGQVCDAGGCC